jgi:thiol-disulfide isomerase/thioredoxin
MKTKQLIYLFALISFFSCKTKENQIFKTPQKVIFAGKVNDYHPDYRSLHISINRLGQPQERIDIPFDSLGYFQTSFETYLPTDFWIVYRNNILAIAHPNDSIYVEFDASKNERTDILKTIKYEGDASKTNMDISALQYRYEESKLNSYDTRMAAIKDFELNEYLVYVDSVYNTNLRSYNEFILETEPTNEAKLWAFTYIEQAYFDALEYYPGSHKYMNQLSDFDVDVKYYEPFLKRLPLNKEMFTNAFSMDSYISNMYNYAVRKTNKSLVNANENLNIDSLWTYGISNSTNDPLLRQLVLFRMFYGRLKNSKIDFYENYKKLSDQYITDNFLKVPLDNLYHKVKSELEAPKQLSDKILAKLKDSAAKPIIDSILIQNKGKVIYIDCWAVWCGPCIANFPASKKLHDKLDGQDIAFVYLCLESDSNKWQNLVKKHDLQGQNYLLDNNQSKAVRDAFEIDGIPHYILIDKNGMIFEKNAAFPGSENKKIEKLIN